jgi:drug/metabolite transporter (DMT)-like permease
VPNWFVFALLAGLFMAVVNILDKFVLEKWARHPMVPVLLLGVFNLFPAAAILLVQGWAPLSFHQVILIAAAGAALLLMTLFYFAAAAREEISRVVPLMFLSPLFVALLAWVSLGETFAVRQYLGIAALIAGAVLVSSRFPFSFRRGRAFWLMLLASLSISVFFVLVKHLLNSLDYWSVFGLTRLSMTLLMLPLYFVYFPQLRDTLKAHGIRVVGVMALDQNIALAANLLITIAAAAGPITLVNALISTQPFFVLLFAVTLSRFFPQLLLGEETQRSTVVQKLLALALMFAGVWLIS